MTTALRTHAAGTLLGCVALIVGLGAAITAIRGRRLAVAPGETTAAILAVMLVGLVISEWVLRMFVSAGG